MKTIAIFTTTRAEFGVLVPFIDKIINHKDLDYRLFVGGTHLKDKYGTTINEIKHKGYEITALFDYLGDDDSPAGLTKSVARATNELANIFENESFDLVCVLGDRYELLSIIQSAILFRKPIIHIHGGEITQGAIDEQIRHMITKSAHIHFVSCEEYYNNVNCMGEQEWRIFNTGALAVENMQASKSISRDEVFMSLGLKKDVKTAILTYHPVTLESNISDKDQINNLFNALDEYDLQVLVTAPNMDSESNTIFQAIKNRVDNRKYTFVKSLGVNKYLSLLQNVDFVIGNSSSGIVEVPFYKIPTINIGSRQDGRLRHKSVIDSNYDKASIKEAINQALSPEFNNSLQSMPYKFGNGQASQKMINSILKIAPRKDLMIKKMEFPC